MQKTRQNLASRNEEAKVQAARADMVLLNEGSAADRVVAAAQGAQRQLDHNSLMDDIKASGNENMLGWYPLVSIIGERLAPADIRMNGRTEVHEHISNKDFGGAGKKVEQGFIQVTIQKYAHEAVDLGSLDTTLNVDSEQGHPTPDKLNKLGGLLTIDQRVSAQLSIAASLILRSILSDVPSKEIADASEAYTTMRVIYVEDLIEYIHTKYRRNLTLDPSTGDAFENMTEGELTNFSTKLIRTFVKARGNVKGSVHFSEGVEGDEYVMKIGKVPSVFDDVYKTRLEAMCTVAKENVGKVWQSKSADAFTTNYGRSMPYNALWIAVAKYLHADDNHLTFGTRNTQAARQDKEAVFDVACSVLTLICLHVITYALSYAFDAYIRLAIRGAERNSYGAIIFNHENVITPQIIFPGIRAAIELYGVSAETWDQEVAFQLSTNKNLLALFLAAKKAYDVDNTKPGVKRFSNPIAEDPYWTRDRSSQSARQSEWEEVKGRFNPDIDVGSSSKSLNIHTAEDNAANLAKSVETYRRIGRQASALNKRFGPVVSVDFGRSRKGGKRRHSGKKSSFGKKRRGSGSIKKRRSGKKKSSFGKKRRHVSGKKSRRGSRKH
jgi:hypothetical protein